MKVEAYDVRLDVHHAKLAYSGTVRVHLEHDGGTLALNSLGLHIDRVSQGGVERAHRLVPEKEELQIEGVPKGAVVVEVAFQGEVPENALAGIYRSEYGTQHAIVTQLEPLGARRVLPCVDHPAQRAVFRVEVVTDGGLQVIFNTPAKSRTSEGGREHYVFEPTPRMATYLLFLGIGTFEERRRRHGTVEIIVATPPGRGDQSEFALDHAGRILDFFGDYFGLPFPLPKLHLIAVPNTAVGGMENWGAISFRERLLLVGPDASQSTKRQVLSVMAHEIAHQWFGDLVTMSWWNDLWLNESFATFMDYKASSHLYPDWQVWSDFALETSNAQLWDALPHSHPVNVPVEDPNQIHGIFDEISYSKGGSVLRMMEAFLGEEVFRAGVARYLKRFAYGNARGEDLWAALNEEAKLPVSEILGDWLNRPGYPALRASYADAQLSLEQERFLLVPEENGGEPEARPKLWQVPINILADGSAAEHLVKGERTHLPVRDLNSVVVGHGRSSFARVRYVGELGASLRRRFPRLSSWDRWGLLQDTFAFLLAGEESAGSYLELVRAAAQEEDYLVLVELLSQTTTLLPVLLDRPAYIRAISDTVRAQSERLGLHPRQGEASRDAVLRQRISGIRVLLDPSFSATLATRFSDWEKEDPSLRGAIAIAYVREKGDAVFDEVLTKLRSSKTDEEKGRLARALGSFRDPEALRRALALPFGGEVTPTTGLEIFVAMIANPHAHRVMWIGLQQFLPILLQNFAATGVVPLMLQWSVPYLGLGREDELRDYFRSLDVGEGSSGLIKGLDLLQIYSGLQHRFPKDL